MPGTVTIEQAVACILVSGEYDFGSHTLPQPEQVVVAHSAAAPASVQSCGNSNQDLFVRGTDAAGTNAAWQLTPTLQQCALDQYGLQVRVAPFAPWVNLSTGDSEFTSVVPGSGYDAIAAIQLPCAGSTGGNQTMSLSVIFTAVIGSSDGVHETEPNNTLAEANLVSLDANGQTSVYGAIDPAGDQDLYRLSFNQPGMLTVRTYDASGDLTCRLIDTVVEVFDFSGSLLAEDDDGGTGLCSATSISIPTNGGTFYVGVRDYDDDHIIGGYRLALSFTP